MKLAPDYIIANFKQILQEEYLRRCKKNKMYSLRAYARSLDIHPASLSLILRGKRAVSLAMISKISRKLELTPSQILLLKEELNTNLKAAKQHEQLSMDYFLICSNWYFDAILELIKLKDFVPSIKWIANVLDLNISEVQIAVDKLLKINFIKIENDKWSVVNNNFNFKVDLTTSKALKDFQRDALKLSESALSNIDIANRYHATQTISVNITDMQKAKELLREFKAKFDQSITSENANSIYQLNLSFYPVSKINLGRDKEEVIKELKKPTDQRELL